MTIVMVVVMIESAGMFLGLVPKMGALVESIPQFVLGGAGLVMFGMVTATGVRIL
jgi:NCS2 family nucleobase:cation symporter-2